MVTPPILFLLVVAVARRGRRENARDGVPTVG
jgi:hypothetical protein